MNVISTTHRRTLSTVFVAAALTLVSSVASAGECPADKIVNDSRMASDAAAKGVTDTVIGSIDLAKEGPRIANHQFRLRQLVVEPEGLVPWHSHAERPAIIYIVSGEIIEHRNTCAEPIVHKAGEVATETHGTSHWWENSTNAPVVLLSADIFPAKMDPNQM